METPETKRARIGYKIVEGIVMKSGTPGNSSGGTRRAQSKTLYQITGLLIVLLLASGLVIFFLGGSPQRNQLEESKDKLINVEASDVATSFELMMQIKSSQLMDLVRKYGSTDSTQSFAETAQTILNQQFSEMQVFICNDLKSLVDSGALGLSYALNIAVGVSGMPFEPMLFAASDPSLVYHWNVPQSPIDAIEEGKPYLYMENGIPELGLEGDKLIAIDMVENNDLRAGIEGV